MDLELGSESPESVVLSYNNGALADASLLPAACALCQRTLQSDTEAGDLEAISICGDCKFLFLEDVGGTPPVDLHRRQSPGQRRSRYSSSESIENMFSQQFSNMINLARQNQPVLSEHENQFSDVDAGARIVQRTSSRTTPSGSRRWRRVFSDAESDGLDSFYGESDVISFGPYGGDSDVSVDGRSFLDNDVFGHRDDVGTDLDSDTDIDPMHAGLNQWNSDDQEDDEGEEEEEEGYVWEVADTERNTNARIFPTEWRTVNNPSENEGRIRVRISRRYSLSRYAGNAGDYLDSSGFEELLERLAETDGSRRGAPPASLSFVNNLERVVIDEEHEKQEYGLACAICKDSLSLGTVVNRLPCFHLYHPSCILPWLSSRNSCPLCRYELPTDDKDYERRKQTNGSSGLEIREMRHQNEDSSSETSEADEAHEINNGRTERESETRRWFALASAAAAPLVSLVGIALVLWLGNPLTERRGSYGNGDFPVHRENVIQAIPGTRNQRENRGRRWWSLF